MSVIIFRLKDVPENEAEEVRELLRSHHLEFYETSEGKWGISIAALWLKHDGDAKQARKLIDDYQLKHGREVREHYENMRATGQLESFVSRLFQYPVQIIIYILLVLLVIYLTLFPFLSL